MSTEQQAREAFENRFLRDANDPSCADELALWCEAWQAAQRAGSAADEPVAALRAVIAEVAK